MDERTDSTSSCSPPISLVLTTSYCVAEGTTGEHHWKDGGDDPVFRA